MFNIIEVRDVDNISIKFSHNSMSYKLHTIWRLLMMKQSWYSRIYAASVAVYNAPFYLNICIKISVKCKIIWRRYNASTNSSLRNRPCLPENVYAQKTLWYVTNRRDQSCLQERGDKGDFQT